MATEQGIRRRLAAYGVGLHKSRGRISPDNLGGYLGYDIGRNSVVFGASFDYSLEDVANWLAATAKGR